MDVDGHDFDFGLTVYAEDSFNLRAGTLVDVASSKSFGHVLLSLHSATACRARCTSPGQGAASISNLARPGSVDRHPVHITFLIWITFRAVHQTSVVRRGLTYSSERQVNSGLWLCSKDN